LWVWHLAWATLDRFGRSHGMAHGAAVAFYAAFSIAPMVVVVTGILLWLLGDPGAQTALLDALAKLIGARESATVAALMARASAPGLVKGAPNLSGWIALGSTLIGATAVFVELRSGVQDMLGETPAAFSWWRLLQVRLLALGIVLGGGFLLSVALVAQTAALLAIHWASQVWPLLVHALAVAEALGSFGVIALLFTGLLRWLPDQRMPWRHAAIGAAVATCLFMVGRYAIGLYIATTATTSALGAAGSFAALLIWVYWSSQIFLLGAALAVELRTGPANHPHAQQGHLPGA
jgi:membrane protein